MQITTKTTPTVIAVGVVYVIRVSNNSCNRFA